MRIFGLRSKQLRWHFSLALMGLAPLFLSIGCMQGEFASGHLSGARNSDETEISNVEIEDLSDEDDEVSLPSSISGANLLCDPTAARPGRTRYACGLYKQGENVRVTEVPTGFRIQLKVEKDGRVLDANTAADEEKVVVRYYPDQVLAVVEVPEDDKDAFAVDVTVVDEATGKELSEGNGDVPDRHVSLSDAVDEGKTLQIEVEIPASVLEEVEAESEEIKAFECTTQDTGADFAVRWTDGNDRCYFRFDADIEYAEAKAKCQAKNAQVISITSAEENTFIFDNLVTSHGFWLGLTDEVTPFDWVWESGEPFSYSNWIGVDPNNGYIAELDIYENCTAINYDGTTAAEWVDLGCIWTPNHLGVICERD